jgi:hypothetical protein
MTDSNSYAFIWVSTLRKGWASVLGNTLSLALEQTLVYASAENCAPVIQGLSSTDTTYTHWQEILISLRSPASNAVNTE